jgi:hypothetical protein
MNNLRDKTLQAVAAKRLEETVKRLGAMRAECLRVFCAQCPDEDGIVVSLADKRREHGRENGRK